MPRPVDPVCAHLRQVRTERGLTQREVAELTGTNRETLCCWEVGLANPSLPLLRAWADALGQNLTAIEKETATHGS